MVQQTDHPSHITRAGTAPKAGATKATGRPRPRAISSSNSLTTCRADTSTLAALTLASRAARGRTIRDEAKVAGNITLTRGVADNPSRHTRNLILKKLLFQICSIL